jgi:hypothetical protein
LDEELISIPHDFEIEITRLVTKNLAFTIDGIDREDAEALAKMEEGFFLPSEQEVLDSFRFHEHTFSEQLRVAARNLALVALVTRLHHWVSRLARRLNNNRKQTSLGKELEFLNAELGQDGPFPIEFFRELEHVRHSVIHADALPEWTDERGRKRCVAEKYRRGDWAVEIGAEEIVAAVDAAIRQVSWYDEMLQAIGK